MGELIGLLFNNIIYNPMMNALLLIYNIIPNYGIAIVLFTLAVGVLTSPFRIKSQQAMKKQQLKMAEIKPKLDELKKKFKDNPQQLQSAQMKLYQENGVSNPFNAGCLLTILPFPIFIGLYNVITRVMADKPEGLMELSQHIYANFANLARLVPVNPIFFGLNLAASPNAQGIAIIPGIGITLTAVIIVGLVVGSQFLQTKMMQQPAASLDPQTAQMNQSMQYMMPLFFGWIVLGAPTGLALYWITFSVVGIVQQYFAGGLGGLEQLLGRKSEPPALPKPKKIAAAAESAGEAALTPSDNGRAAQLPASTQRSSKKGKKKSGK